MLLLPLYWEQVRGESALGAAMIALQGAAFVGLGHEDIPQGSSISRVAQQIGGSAGTAVLAMILARTSAGAHPPRGPGWHPGAAATTDGRSLPPGGRSGPKPHRIEPWEQASIAMMSAPLRPSAPHGTRPCPRAASVMKATCP
jgi:hypothetical protein